MVISLEYIVIYCITIYTYVHITDDLYNGYITITRWCGQLLPQLVL